MTTTGGVSGLAAAGAEGDVHPFRWPLDALDGVQSFGRRDGEQYAVFDLTGRYRPTDRGTVTAGIERENGSPCGMMPRF